VIRGRHLAPQEICIARELTRYFDAPIDRLIAP